MLCLSNHALTINTRVWQRYFRCLEQAHPATHPSTRSNGLSTIPEQLHNVEHGNARHVNYDSLLPYMKHAAHQRFSCTATFEWTQKCPTSKTVPTIAYLPSSVPGPHVSSHIPWAGRPLTDAALYAMCKTQQACLQGVGWRNWKPRQQSKAAPRPSHARRAHSPPAPGAALGPLPALH